MATLFSTIEDLGLIAVEDYKMAKLYEMDINAFQKYCDGFLIKGVTDCQVLKNKLSFNLETREFDEDLTFEEQGILADYFAIEWMTREVQDSKQFQLKLKNSGSFQFNSESQNLKEKSVYLDKLRERVNQKITQYELNIIADKNTNADFW